MKATFETKKAAAKQCLSTMMRDFQFIELEPEECIEVVAMVAATMIECIPKPLTRVDGMSVFFTRFASTLESLNEKP